MAFEADATLIWKIENFGMCPDEFLYSPYFMNGCYFCKVHPYGLEDSESLSLHLKRSYVKLNVGEKELVEYRISVLGRDGEEIMRRTAKNVFGLGDEVDFGRFIKREILVGEKKTSSLSPGNVLTIRCDIRKVPEEEDFLYSDSREAKLLSDQLSQILSSGLYSDVELIAEGERFKAHMIVLKTRCYGLAKLLDDRNNPNKEYMLTNIRASNLRSILRYLYTGTFEARNLNSRLLVDLDRFGLYGLKHSLLNLGKKTVEATSTILVSRLFFRWSIKDWKSLSSGSEFVYPAYCLTENAWDKLEIVLTAVGKGDALENFQLVFKKLDGSEIAFMRTKIRVTTDEGFFPLTESEHHFKEREYILQLEAWLIDFESVDGSVELLFEIALSKFHPQLRDTRTLVNAHKDFDPSGAVIKNYKLLQKNLKSLIDGKLGTFSSMHSSIQFLDGDVTLCAGEKEFRVHKVLLCARSPTFARMQEEGIILGEEVIIEDISSETTSHLLYYIYSGCVKNLNLEQAVSLYKAARKYELPSLENLCISRIESSLDADSVGESLLLVRSYDGESLRALVHNFVARNFKAVLRSRKTADTLKRNPQVYPELFEALAEAFSSEGCSIRDGSPEASECCPGCSSEPGPSQSGSGEVPRECVRAVPTTLVGPECFADSPVNSLAAASSQRKIKRAARRR